MCFLDAGNAGAIEVVIVLARLYELVVLYVRLHRLSIHEQAGLIFGFFFIHFVEKEENFFKKEENYVSEKLLSVFGGTMN